MNKTILLVLISKQIMYVVVKGEIIKKYPVSTSKYGIGNREGSNKTPLGWHRITRKIGGRAHLGEVFVNRRRTGRITSSILKQEDLITSRILVLEGLEPGVNKGKGIDSLKRAIYIHGTAEERLIGNPASHGCIRMRNRDIMKLFDTVRNNDLVLIVK